jgi:hypothetical protein
MNVTLAEKVVEHCHNNKDLLVKFVNVNAPEHFACTMADVCHITNVIKSHVCEALVSFDTNFRSPVSVYFKGSELVKSAAYGELTGSWSALEELIKNYDGVTLKFQEDTKYYSCDANLQVRV